MGNRASYDQNEHSNEKSLLETSNEVHMKKNRVNKLDVRERDYMINTAMKRLHIDEKYRAAVAKAANYIGGDRFWTIMDYATRSKVQSKSHYFIKAINRELYG